MAKRFGGIKARLKELCRKDHGDNLADLARALGLRQPTLWKMVSGNQQPSTALLMALARKGVNLHWLLEGRGPQRLEGADALLRGGVAIVPRVPVAPKLLDRGPSGDGGQRLGREAGPLEGIFSPTQYWIQVTEADPVTRHTDAQLVPGEWLLLECDPKRFPRESHLEGKFVVVPGSVTDKSKPSLARVEEVDEERLWVDNFDRGIDPSLLHEEFVIRLLPGNKLQASRRHVVRETAESGSRRFERLRELRADELCPSLLPVKFGDILAVCVLSVRSR
jgi:transcriptional regulator with XRE-family HTH domain